MGDVVTPEQLPPTLDWRVFGAVPLVLDQGTCSNSWAFATSDAIAAAWYLAHNNLESLSAEQLTSCDFLCQGCAGGWFGGALMYAVSEALVDARSYPFTSFEGQTDTCADSSMLFNGGGADSKSSDSDSSTAQELWELPSAATSSDGKHLGSPKKTLESSGVKVQASSWTRWKPGSPNELMLALVRNGPLALAVRSGNLEFYTGGVDSGQYCGEGSPDHAMLLVGYDLGKSGGEPHWILKNSWGDTWGENGYWRLRMVKENNQASGEADPCGLLESVTAVFI
eukprot:CAMPEP_0113952146 /NCGR_PEP_ID=MMETSP1339-20121228/89976_1 /TAXON_ID=94617 /ORGANISM="Fibrocapsa japonica" /LENGTH=281 /DNA_ID=CAMNT_0000960689 /DNA_START=359 /DNA_END=1204 /DNA_ORIENTATION=- /assembly_acc=CAM_ASM_000762